MVPLQLKSFALLNLHPNAYVLVAEAELGLSVIDNDSALSLKSPPQIKYIIFLSQALPSPINLIC